MSNSVVCFFSRVSILILIFFSINLHAQCPTGSEPGCTCESAEILCSINELDGYTFSMDAYSHPWDGPNNGGNLCGTVATVSNNPTWFGFTAWCTDMSMIVYLNDCSITGSGTTGLQVAIYDGCGPDANYVACDLSCGNENDKFLDMMDLDVGGVYYLVVDGCAGSVCQNIEIEITSGCGPTVVQDWESEIEGPDQICTNSPETYIVDDLDGANRYHWYIDGVEVDITSSSMYDLIIDTPGTYELCVDASNDPCIPVDEPPDQICKTITVVDIDPGDISIDPSTLCPEDFTNVLVSNASTDALAENWLLFVDSDGFVVDKTMVNPYDFTYDQCGLITVYSISINPNVVTLPEIGEFFMPSLCDVGCCELIAREVSFEDGEGPVFTDPPADLFLNCLSDIPSLNDLNYTDNCSEDGIAPGEESTNDPCDNLEIIRTWKAEDACGNETIHEQKITLEIDENSITIMNAPQDMNVSCYDDIAPIEDLEYNYICTGLNSVAGVESGSADLCAGGVIIRTWTIPLECGIEVIHTQEITVEPMELPVYDSAPADMTIACADYDELAPPVDLMVSNGMTGTCEIMETVAATTTDDVDLCGGQVIHTWSYDYCNTSLVHQQVIDVQAADQAFFLDAPEPSLTIECIDDIPVPPVLTLTNKDGDANCTISENIAAQVVEDFDHCGGTVEHIWSYTDACNRVTEYIQTITINPAPIAEPIDPPSDITIMCSEIGDIPPDLVWDNGQGGICGSQITLPGLRTGIDDICGTQLVDIWQGTDACGNDLYYERLVTVEPAPIPTFVDPPSDATMSCEEMQFLVTSLDVTNEESGFCQIQGSVEAEISGSYDGCGGDLVLTWLFIDECGRTISHTQNITVTPTELNFVDPPGDIDIDCGEEYAGAEDLIITNGLEGECEITQVIPATSTQNGNSITNLWEYYSDCSASIISHLQYVYLPEELDYTVNSVSCSPDNLSYNVSIEAVGEVSADLGTVTSVGTDSYEVTDIPVGQSVVITITDGGCTETTTINPPDCSCPDINPPTAEDIAICVADLPYNLTVNTEAGYTANWYNNDDPTTSIASETTSYELSGLAAGTYTYLVETYDPTTECTSNIKTTITVVISNPPSVMNPEVSLCESSDGPLNLNLSDYNSMITGTGNTVTFYDSMADAESGDNPITGNVDVASDITYYTRVESASGCINTGTLYIELLSAAAVTITTADVSCTDAGDGMIFLDFGGQAIQTKLDDGNFSATDQYDNLSAGSYTVTSRDENGCENVYDVSIEAGLAFTDINLQSECNDNGTTTDETDDYYEITIAISNNRSNSGTFTLSFDQESITSNYGEDNSFTLPADGSTYTFTIEDTEELCTETLMLGPLDPCSTDCEIEIVNIDYVCNDNGTETDATDDSYSFTIEVTSINGSAAGTYEVYLNGNQAYVFDYDAVETFSFPAEGNLTVEVRDTEKPQCRESVTFNDLTPCSNNCEITYTLEAESCFNNDTPLDITDDYWEFAFSVEGLNVGEGTFDVLLDGTVISTETFGEQFIITIPSDDLTHEITFQDADGVCMIYYITPILVSCPEACDISATVVDIICDNAGTNNTGDDDTYMVNIRINSSEAGSFTIPELNISASYNSTVNIGPLLISDGSQSITIQDNETAECRRIVNFDPPEPCSECTQSIDAGEQVTISCEDLNVVLSGTASDTGDFAWYNTVGTLLTSTEEVTVSSAGKYFLEVSFADGCVLRDSVEVLADDDIPVGMVEADGTITCDNESVLLTATTEDSSGNFTFTWYDEAATEIGSGSEISVQDPGSYYVIIEDVVNGCRSGELWVEVDEQREAPTAVIYADPSTVIDCQITSIVLSHDEEENVDYIWMIDGEEYHGEEIQVSEIGEYGLMAVDTISGCSNFADIFISSLVDYPVFDLQAEGRLGCDDEEVSLTVDILETSDSFVYTWSNENDEVVSTDDALLVQEAGLYIVNILDENNGCSNTDSIFIPSSERAFDITLTPYVVYTEGDEVTLSATVDIPESEIDSVYWLPSEGMTCPTCLTTTLTEVVSDSYEIVITDIYGCQASAIVELEENKIPVVEVPNVLKVDGGTRITVYGNEEIEEVLEFLIFDRWGNLMFSQENIPLNDVSAGWDGTFNNNFVNPGVYVYKVEVLLADGTTDIIYGDITVLN